jgi:hypothetical protein
VRSLTNDKGKEIRNEKTENERDNNVDEDEEEADDNEVWSTDTSADAVRRRQLEVFGGSEIAKLVLNDNSANTDTHSENINNKSNENNNVPPPSSSPTDSDPIKDLLEYLNKQNPKPNEFFAKVTKIAKIEGIHFNHTQHTTHNTQHTTYTLLFIHLVFFFPMLCILTGLLFLKDGLIGSS